MTMRIATNFLSPFANPYACPPQRLMIAHLAPIDHDPHRLAVTVYHHEVRGAESP